MSTTSHDVLSTPTDLEEVADRDLVVATRGTDQEADAAREELTDRYQPLVIGQSARMHRGRGEGHKDVISVAQVGLQKAIDGFDLDRGSPFAAYARAKVRGELMRWFRDGRYSVHVPRPLHERFMQVRRAKAQLEDRLHREPEVEEVAEHLECEPEEVVEAMAVRSAERVRTRQLVARLGGSETDDRPNVDLSRAVDQLTDRKRLIIHRRYVEGCPQRKIGEELGISQAHVSRLERRALDELRERLPEPA